MGLTTLLDPRSAKLARLSLARVQLDRQEPVVEFTSAGEEVLLYPLVGGLHLEIDGPRGRQIRTRTGRRSVFEGLPQPLRLPSGQDWTLRATITGHAADILVVSAPGGATTPHELTDDLLAVDVFDVGDGAHRREVRVVETPRGALIHAGETINPPGHWSSWPSHSTPAERARYAEHEEVFFLITGGFGMIQLEGVYCDGAPVDSWLEVRNGAALVTPLGNHPIVADPAHPLYYAWFYVSFLTKTYNRFGTDVGTYVR